MFRNPVTDVIVVLVIALLIFGPKRLPMLGRSLGQGLKEFKDSITGDSSHHSDAEERPALTQATPAEPAATSAEPAAAPAQPAAAPATPERQPADVGSPEGRG